MRSEELVLNTPVCYYNTRVCFLMFPDEILLSGSPARPSVKVWSQGCMS